MDLVKVYTINILQIFMQAFYLVFLYFIIKDLYVNICNKEGYDLIIKSYII